MPSLSQDPADNNRKIGLAYILANLNENSDKKAWANTGLRRQGTVALQMGYEIAAAIEKYPYFLDAIKEYVGSEFAAEVAKDEISVYGLLLSTSLCRYVPESESSQELLRVCKKYNEVVVANPCRLDLVTEVNERLTASPDEIGTWFFADVANALFGDVGEKYTPDPEDVPEEQEKNGSQNHESGDDTQQDQPSQGAPGAGDGKPEQADQNEQAAEDQEQQAGGQPAPTGQQAQDADSEGSGSSDGSEQVAEDEPAQANEQGSNGQCEHLAEEGESQQQDAQPDQELQTDANAQAAGEDDTQETDGVAQEPQIADSEQPEEGGSAESADVTQETADGGQVEPDAEQQQHAYEAMELFEAEDAEDDPSKVSCVHGGAGGSLAKPLEARKRIEIDNRTNGVLVSTIIKIFQATEEQPTGLSKCGSKVSIKHAWRMKALGDTRIFKKNREDPGVDMAMSILVDRSESMGHLLHKVCNTAHTFAMGLTRVPGAKVRLAAFPAIGPVSTTTLLEFDEHPKRAEERLSMLYADGSTPLAQAIVAECSRLLERNEPKKVITVLTDGVPDSGPQVKNAILRAESLGIEVIGIGFGDAKSITNWIEKAEYISEVDELPNALASIFEKTLATQS